MSAPDELPQALERLVTLGQSPDVNIRPVLLRVVVDLFVRKEHHAPADLAQFEAIALHLIEDADPQARLIVAEKLSRHPATPRALLNRLIAEQGEVAARVFRFATLDAETLTAAATWSDSGVAEAIAARPDLPPATVTALADRPEGAVAHVLSRNTGSELDRLTFQKLARRAKGDATLAGWLVGRAGNPIDLAPLFPLVDAAPPGRGRGGRRGLGRSSPPGSSSWATRASAGRWSRCGRSPRSSKPCRPTRPGA